MIVEIRDEVIALSGKLERNHWRTLESAVNVRLRHHPAGIVVDCGGLSALTPEGAKTFREAADHIARSGARIVVANVPVAIMRVLRQIPNLGSQLPLAASVADARASLGLPAPDQASHGARSGGSAAGFLDGGQCGRGITR
jgi:anti-anti-sigma regulatory factor